jgi:hypothetical protein
MKVDAIILVTAHMWFPPRIKKLIVWTFVALLTYFVINLVDIQVTDRRCDHTSAVAGPQQKKHLLRLALAA